MKIDRDIFLSALLAGGLIGATACGGSEEPVEEETTSMDTAGSEDTFEPEPMDDGMGEDDGMGDDMGMEEEEPEEDMGPTPE